MVQKVKSQMKAHFFHTSDPISIIDFLATFKLACDTNRVHEGVPMRVLPFLVINALASTLNSCMLATISISPAVVFVHFAKPLKQERFLWSYREVFNYFLKRFANDQAIAEKNSAILRYTQPASVTFMQ